MIPIPTTTAAPLFPRELLIVEDDAIQLKAYDAFARRYSIGVRTTARTTEVLRLAHLHQPDGIVLDVELEDGHSLNLLRALKASPSTKDIPVVVISGYLSGQVLALMRSLGVPTLAKPWTVDELVGALGGLCAKQALKPPKVAALR